MKTTFMAKSGMIITVDSLTRAAFRGGADGAIQKWDGVTIPPRSLDYLGQLQGLPHEYGIGMPLVIKNPPGRPDFTFNTMPIIRIETTFTKDELNLIYLGKFPEPEIDRNAVTEYGPRYADLEFDLADEDADLEEDGFDPGED